MLLYIIRHGDPIYEPDSLTKKGHLQAQALSKRLAVNGLDEIYVSPLLRAKQTAEPTCKLLGIDYKVEEWANEGLLHWEMNYKNEKGETHWIFHQQSTNLKNDDTIYLTDNWHTADCFNVDGKDYKSAYDKICKSSDDFLERLGYKRKGSIYEIVKPNEKRVALFCHQGVGLTFLSHLLSIPPHIFWTSFDITHSSVTILKFNNYENGLTSPVCLTLSDISHIYKEDLPFEYNNYLKL